MQQQALDRAYNADLSHFLEEECHDLEKHRFSIPDRIKFVHDVQYVRGAERIFAAKLQSLHKCAAQDNVDGCLYFILEKRNKVDRFDDWGETPSHRAAHHGSINAMKCLASRGCNLNLQSLQKGWTPVHYAANAGHPELVQCLYDLGADTTLQDKAGFTAAHLAAQCNQIEVLKTLFVCQPNLPLTNTCLSKTSNSGLTPTHVAATFDRIEALMFLAKCGCDTLMLDSFKESALHKAARNNNLKCVKFLGKIEGSDMDQENLECDTPAGLMQQCSRHQQVSMHESGPSQVAIQQKAFASMAEEGNHLFKTGTEPKKISYLGTDRFARTPAEMRAAANLKKSVDGSQYVEKKPAPPPGRPPIQANKKLDFKFTL